MVTLKRTLRYFAAAALCTGCLLCQTTPSFAGLPAQSPAHNKVYQAARTWGPVAQASARQWLALVDYKKYTQCWDQSSVLFRESVSKAKWVAAVALVRQHVGALRTRSMKTMAYTNMIPGHIQGDYFVIRYDTLYALQGKSTETVTLAREQTGAWKVIGYYVIPGTV